MYFEKIENVKGYYYFYYFWLINKRSNKILIKIDNINEINQIKILLTNAGIN